MRRRKVSVLEGDSLELLKTLPDCSVDSVCCDPPAGIGFMGRYWDSPKGGRISWIDWLTEILEQALRVLKPGGHALVWALPRTSHWTGTAIEQAGFEVRDQIDHLFGTGFPKSLDVGKDLEEWQGWGTALKPAREVWWLARKPLSESSIVANLERWGVGVLNVDGCKVKGNADGIERWPPHVLLTHGDKCTELECAKGCPVLELAEQSGIRPSAGNLKPTKGGHIFNQGNGRPFSPSEVSKGDSGTAARYFPQFRQCELDRIWFRYVAKPARREREGGCEHLPKLTAGEATGERKEGSAGLRSPRAGAGRTKGAHNSHPTVKGIELMRWLVRLVTPPGGTVLDPFVGSGSTLIAAGLEGMGAIGMELDPYYAEIARARTFHALGGQYTRASLEQLERAVEHAKAVRRRQVNP